MRTLNTVIRNHHRLRSVGMIVLLIALSLAGMGHGPSRAAIRSTAKSVIVTPTCDSLESFINQCSAQSGKALTEEQASQLINAATELRTELGCQ